MAREAKSVVASDFSPEMLAQGKRRGAERVVWVQADALELPFGDESFDVVTIGYGLRNLSDFEGGLRELLRVLKPGGRLLILDFGKPSSFLLRTLYFGYLRLAVPVLGLIFCGDRAAYSYILDSLREYPAQDGVTRWLCDKGAEVRVTNFLGGAMSLHRAVKGSLREGNDVPLEAGHLVRQ
jgi:demethylmenaquinone methyltransferase/2-methoxy-6-polyprenyl-1,4-benzoquinol methylase